MVALMASTGSSVSCEPRFRTERTPGRRSIGSRLRRVAEQLGQPPMPHQQLVFDVAGELIQDEETGFWLPAYPEVFVTMPRQEGKTTLLLVFEIDRAVLWEGFDGRPQSIAYTAQSGSEARKKFRSDQVPLLKSSPFWGGIDRARFAADDMGLEFSNGAKLTVWNNAEDSGHGSVVDLGVIDEVFADQDDRREQAFIPAMATRHDRQKLITSTAGTEKSSVFNRKQTVGRQAVEAGRTEGSAYFEWSADPKSDPEDPATWWSCMPALGFTITERTVRSALDEMRKENGDLAEFSRAWLNIPTNSAGERVIPFDVWERINIPSTTAPSMFAVDINPERTWSSVAVSDGKSAELVEHRPGVDWVAGRLLELNGKWRAPIAIDATGPAGSLIDGLERAGATVQRYESRQYAYACQAFFDRCIAESVSIHPNRELDIAVAGAARRTVGDGWAWSRRNDQTVISPLVAVTLAVHAASKPVSSPAMEWI